MRGAVVPLMRQQRFAGLGRRVVNKFVALAHRKAFGTNGRYAFGCSGLEPRFAAVVGALNDLSEPAAVLRSVDAVRISRRAFQVINLPPGEVRPAHVPLLTFSV